MNSEAFTKVHETAQFLEAKFGKAPKIASVLGSGLGAFADTLSHSQSILTTELPSKLSSTVEGHQGKLVRGFLGKTPLLVLAGRLHGYEGYSPYEVVLNIRALRVWGVQYFIVTNACGSVRLAYRPGTFVLLEDHINFTGKNPLTGQELYCGTRFPDMSETYSKTWRKLALQTARKINVPVKQGVYVGVMGPSFETPGEIKMFAKWGAHIVGMSTVWEVIALKQMGAEILGVSCVTNYGTGVKRRPLNHHEVLQRTQMMQETFNRYMKALVEGTAVKFKL